MNLNWENTPTGLFCWVSLGGHFMINVVDGPITKQPALLLVGGSGWTSHKSQQAMKNKPVISTPSLPLIEFLPLGNLFEFQPCQLLMMSLKWSCKLKSTFSDTKCNFRTCCLMTGIETPTKINNVQQSKYKLHLRLNSFTRCEDKRKFIYAIWKAL